ncbi:MAG: 1-acyl-sn-glycerol-3-phosphate acyltransferase [Paludibacteraceae bacterium]|nr:1-acyl-sn-glycerol-3-phosphate acyltransferase [Paludibacteraceae bacterium]
MRVCAVIPAYNNVGTVADVVRRTLAYLPVILVADGPTDGSLQAVQAIDSDMLTIVAYAQNRGKGYALKRGLLKAKELGYTHVLTLDADGQHFPEDIPAMLRMARVRPEAIIMGSRGLEQDNMPGKNTFANRFSNFWFRVQTGMKLPDTQTGFRVYPLAHLHGLHLMTRRYEAELLLLVFSAWASTPIVPVPIRVYYPPQQERVSFFMPAKDFTRISILNTFLCLLAVVYGLPRRYWRTVCYSLLFGCFAIACNCVFAWYSLFCPEKKLSKLRHVLAIGSLRFLNTFPGRGVQVRLAPGAKPLGADGPSVVIANHTSLLDVLLLLSISDKMVMVGKEWVANNFLFGRIARAMGIITIEEGVDNFFPTLQSYVEKGYSVGIFPEGTRTINGEVGRFHRGAFFVAEQLNLPICPIVLQGFLLALSKTPYFVGRPAELRATIMPLIPPSDTSLGTDYRERTRAFRAKYMEWICDYD